MLRTNYKDDILAPGQNARKYRMQANIDGTVSLVDETEYTQEGDTFGGGDMNATNEVVNFLNEPQTFSILTSAWVANTGSDATDFPYVANITTSLYTSSFTPSEVLLLGADPTDYPTAADETAIGVVDKYVKFTGTSIRLRATSAPASTLNLVVRG